MKKLFAVIRSRSGETLAETLSAILIISLASVALASMISAASEMNIAVRNSDNDLYSDIGQLEEGTTGVADGTARLTVTVNGSPAAVDYDVNVLRGEHGQLKKYDYAGGAAP